MMLPSGTFDYVGVVPDDWRRPSAPWRLRDTSAANPHSGNPHSSDDRLTGLSPFLEIEDAGVTPGAVVSPYTATVRPFVTLSRLTLRADGRERAAVAAFSFCVDQSLLQAMRPGDHLYLTRTLCAGLGLSIVRDERLVAAAGALTHVPLGSPVRVQHPAEALQRAEAELKTLDPTFEFHETPIEVVADVRRVLYRGHHRVGKYALFVEHGFLPGLPGKDECGALADVERCPLVGATCSAQLMEYRDLAAMVRW